MICLITALIFISVMLLFSAAGCLFLPRKSVLMERVERLLPEQKVKKAPPFKSGSWGAKLSRMGETIKLPEREHSKYLRFLVAAGYNRETVYLFFGSKILLASAFPLLYLFLVAGPRRNYCGDLAILTTVACTLGGYLLPSYWLYTKKRRRQGRIFHSLPDILDLMTLCVEAGLSMDAAFIKITDTPQFDKDPLAKEIRIVTMESRAGKPRVDSLKDMAERTMVDDVVSFTTMLAQAERFGTSLSQAMRTFSDSLRTRRRQIAEEAAAKTTIKMVFPLILFIFPALLVVILGPALIQIGKIFK